MRVTLYGKSDCPLCDKLKLDLDALRVQVEFVLEERNIEADAVDFERFRYLIPRVGCRRCGAALSAPHLAAYATGVAGRLILFLQKPGWKRIAAHLANVA